MLRYSFSSCLALSLTHLSSRTGFLSSYLGEGSRRGQENNKEEGRVGIDLLSQLMSSTERLTSSPSSRDLTLSGGEIRSCSCKYEISSGEGD